MVIDPRGLEAMHSVGQASKEEKGETFCYFMQIHNSGNLSRGVGNETIYLIEGMELNSRKNPTHLFVRIVKTQVHLINNPHLHLHLG